MTPRERVLNRIEGKPVDRIPNLNILMQFAARYIGVPYSKYVTDYRYLVEGNIKCCDEFGIDMVSAISDPMREASGFGADIVFPEDGVPYSRENLIREYGDLKKLSVRDPLSADRMLDRIRAIELYKREVGDRYPILGWVEGAFAEAVDLRGMTELMVDLYDEPDFVRELLEICNEQAILFAREQIRAGADFIGIGDAAASLVSPAVYREFVLPYEQKLIDSIHREGARVKLHICGNISNHLEDIALTGADMVDIDWMVDFEKTIRILGDRAAACGNFDPVKVLLEGSLEDIAESVKKCISVATDTTFVAAGCEVPKYTPYENLRHVARVIAEVSGT